MKKLIQALSIFVFASQIQAASFDCSQAKSFIEKAICSETQLSNLDEQMVTIYKENLYKSVSPNKLKVEQKN